MLELRDKTSVDWMNGAARDMATGKITSIEAGFVTGWVDSALPGDHVSLLINRRVVQTAPLVSRPSPRRLTFSIDGRGCPPAFLLSDHLQLAVELTSQPGRHIDTKAIATADLLRLAGLRVNRQRAGLEGCIDGVDGGRLRGWVWDKARPDQRADVLVFIGDRFIGKFKAQSHRADLAATGHGDGRYGFEIPLRSVLSGAGAEADVTVLVGGGTYWPIPFGRHAKAQRKDKDKDGDHDRSDASTALGRDLGSIDYFARMLTSGEPFPKKAFVLDQVDGSMPDAFAADYVLLALEYLRHEMVAAGEAKGESWRRRLGHWARMRAIGTHIRRLEELAKAISVGPALLAVSRIQPAVLEEKGARRGDPTP